MDYGKLAYLKAVDLENRKTESGRSNVCYFTFKNLNKGRIEIAELSGSGDAAVFVNCSEKAVFYVDGVRVTEGDSVFFKVNGGGKITAECEQDIEELCFLAIGDIASYERSGTAYADCLGDRIGYLLCDNGRVRAYVMSLPSLALSEIFDGNYAQGDIAATDDGFILALVDDTGAITVVKDGASQKYYLGAQKVAIDNDAGLTIAYIKDGEAYYFCGEFGDPISKLNKIGFGGHIDDVRFVKKGGGMLFTSGGKCYIKEVNRKVKTASTLYVDMTAEVI